ncbi:hypothetical protein DKX38_027496 [Salix brachista]|uniref:Uncharacterized protein n=1 Tax=Salix brachista TaxID=2182728 RepID=A0A5N5JC52_9ROSI|nr:hypothetical protein DKX38_027496 [Salix brachista]
MPPTERSKTRKQSEEGFSKRVQIPSSPVCHEPATSSSGGAGVFGCNLTDATVRGGDHHQEILRSIRQNLCHLSKLETITRRGNRKSGTVDRRIRRDGSSRRYEQQENHSVIKNGEGGFSTHEKESNVNPYQKILST